MTKSSARTSLSTPASFRRNASFHRCSIAISSVSIEEAADELGPKHSVMSATIRASGTLFMLQLLSKSRITAELSVRSSELSGSRRDANENFIELHLRLDVRVVRYVRLQLSGMRHE